MYQSGQKVRHAKFGEGIVIAVRSDASGQKVDVAFVGIGIKTFVSALAPMEVVK